MVGDIMDKYNLIFNPFKINENNYPLFDDTDVNIIFAGGNAMNLEQLTTACPLYNRVFSNKSYLTEDKVALIKTPINEKNARLIRYYDIKYHTRGEKDQEKVLSKIQEKYNISNEELTSTEYTIGKEISDVYDKNYECDAITKRDNSEDVVLLWLKQLDYQKDYKII